SAPPIPLEELVAQREWIARLARALTRDPASADDLEQETWLAAVERPPEDQSRLRGWLGTVMRRAASKHRRGERRRARREGRAARADGGPSTLDLVARVEW